MEAKPENGKKAAVACADSEEFRSKLGVVSLCEKLEVEAL